MSKKQKLSPIERAKQDYETARAKYNKTPNYENAVEVQRTSRNWTIELQRNVVTT